MKKLIYLFGVFSLIGLFTISCETENKEGNGDKLVFSGQLIKKSVCKNEIKSLSYKTIIPDSLSCIEYAYDNTNNILTMKHINAGFNCCPDSLYIQTLLDGNVITIQEYERSALCRCNCLYDLDIKLNGIEAKEYQVVFAEPYIADQQEIIFDIDLKTNIEGHFCVTRKQYPWGVNSMN